jgi:DNA-binding SARP family transcriptional activator
MDVLQVTLFGKACIQRGSSAIVELPAKALELLCYMLLHRGRAHTREALACELWADAPATQSKKYLRQSLWQLQQAVDLPQTKPLLCLDHDWVTADPDAEVQLDVLQFECASAVVRDLPGATLTTAQAQAAMQAAALYTGELLSGWYQEWCLIERARYHSMFFALLDKLIDYCRAHRLFDQGIAYAMRLLRSDYTHERTHRQLMRLYHQAGDRSLALRQFEQCRAVLLREFGLAPAEATLALAEQIRTGQPEGAIAAPAAEPDSLATLLAELGSLRASVAQLRHELALVKRTLST